MRVLVCGGRDFGNVPGKTDPSYEDQVDKYQWTYNELGQFACKNSIHYKHYDNWLPSDIHIIAGGARGVDSAAVDWAVINYAPFTEYKADWKKYKKAAGAIRNQQMLDEGKPDIVLAFPGGTGTKDMVRRAIKAGIPVRHFEYPY